MTQSQANSKSGENQYLVGNKYKNESGYTLIVNSVTLWNETGNDNGWEAHAFFEQYDSDLEDVNEHININMLTPPRYQLFS
jgi:hypothetical protein